MLFYSHCDFKSYDNPTQKYKTVNAVAIALVWNIGTFFNRLVDEVTQSSQPFSTHVSCSVRPSLISAHDSTTMLVEIPTVHCPSGVGQDGDFP